MDTLTSRPHAVVEALAHQVLPLFPPAIREAMAHELPAMRLHAWQLGFEVLEAERGGLVYSSAVMRPDFLRMGRVHFGAVNLLQWRVPKAVRPAVGILLGHAAEGTFDPTRQLLFEIASRGSDADAALCRFFLWVAIKLNLLIATWDSPEIEATGALEEIDAQSERLLRELLDVRDIHARDVRPLHVLIGEALFRLFQSVNDIEHAIMGAVQDFGAELMADAEVLRVIRSLDAQTAAALNPGPFDGPAGAQQIADRFPQCFASANAVDQRRSRFRKKPKSPARADDRLIDLILSYAGRRS